MTAIDKHALNPAELESALQELKRISEQPAVGSHYARVLRQHIANLNGELGAAKNQIAELESENGKLQGMAREQNVIAIRAQLDSNVAALEMRMLHKRLTELEAREARTYVPLPLNIEDEYRNHEYVAGWNDCRNAASVRQQTPAVCDVIAERYRQQSVEGWTSEHDDEHGDGELALAASCYAENFALFSTLQEGESVDWSDAPQPANWPWSSSWWKPSSPRRDLVKAGALILAEIERGDRAVAADTCERK
ncbi:TPA_asm: hypothetical protein G1X19_11190 [Salmonella enterica subsp. enterica serovar Typhimurium str. SL1344]|uniref:Ead/Ea22-like family protein n=1 Tax=Salmonella typhimurium (strain SL1344) TaxID=216597 RepID=A0A718RIS9_SALTS|nr:hypothetical protein [Salmonella enterica]EDU9586137.1 hypothetical protein [Salmonella enterica subsp. enterica serovar Kisangani]HAD6674491.1 hypothetical protein [Salmonella enterica subsp. enterica serovar Typhimurium str. SL1344]HAD6692755.1 hypothetical protein [Salmonella enterica subsp. enterica serovar Typhimurium str. SL1344]HAD6716204.1 hypothetical protein [Salmonella enterica subsp. enterica serovar Typhimurium str. SL1344]